ncbi:MAG: Nif3-like dinuclear metal center hexameric protein [Thioalkalivibrionaceae bacterium]
MKEVLGVSQIEGAAEVERDILVAALAEHLDVAAFDDYCPNGLQVEGRSRVRRVMSGVTASQALIDAAIDWQADALIVHHGFFWKGEPAPLTGIKARRIAALMGAGINLLTYHLPLDVHPELGNNAQLARSLELEIDGALRPDGLGCVGHLPSGLSAPEFARRIEKALNRSPLWLDGGRPVIQRVAWCTGAAQRLLIDAAMKGVDAYVSGEVSEQTTHEARELKVHYFAAGHHATERGGPQALGDWVAREFGVQHRFVDCPNPV